MTDLQVLIGDSVEMMRTLADGSVQLYRQLCILQEAMDAEKRCAR